MVAYRMIKHIQCHPHHLLPMRLFAGLDEQWRIRRRYFALREGMFGGVKPTMDEHGREGLSYRLALSERSVRHPLAPPARATP
jgi:hypothetical protein